MIVVDKEYATCRIRSISFGPYGRFETSRTKHSRPRHDGTYNKSVISIIYGRLTINP